MSLMIKGSWGEEIRGDEGGRGNYGPDAKYMKKREVIPLLFFFSFFLCLLFLA